MPTGVRRLAVLAITIVAVGCGGAQEDDPASLEGDVAASVSAIEDDPSPSSTGSPTAEASPSDAGETAGDGPPCTVAADESSIEVAEPAAGAIVDTTIRLVGCGNTFEATYLWEVELADGTIAGSGFGTMTCGTGCVGSFDDEVVVDGSGDATLRVFEEDAVDGSRVNVVEVPITIEP